MKKLLLFLLFFLTACQGIVPIHLTNSSSIEDQELVEEGVALLGLSVEFVDFEYGAANLELRDDCEAAPEGFYCGSANEMPYHRCHNVSAWVTRNQIFIAHEIGHLLGLGHSSDPGNLMFGVTMGTTLTTRQMEDAYDRASLLNSCR